MRNRERERENERRKREIIRKRQRWNREVKNVERERGRDQFRQYTTVDLYLLIDYSTSTHTQSIL